MGRTVIVSRRHDRLSQLIMKKMYDAVAVSNFKIDLQRGDQLCWLPKVADPVDDEVQELAALVDRSVFIPRKIIMLSMAGTADDASSAQLKQWYGKKFQKYLWAHQYAIKMIDELELPYTIIRALPFSSITGPTVFSKEGQKLRGHGIDERSLAQAIVQILDTDRYNGESIGVSTGSKEDQHGAK